MARKKSYKRKAYKAKSKARRRAKKKNVIPRSIVSLGAGFPQKIMVTHHYNELQSITATLGVPTSKLWSLNGMWDPNAAVGGHQPMYFDQMSALYNHYVVVGSKMTLKIIAHNAGQPSMFFVTSYNDDTSITASALDTQAEYNRSKVTLIPAGSGNVYTVNFNYSAKKIFGKGVLANTSLQGDAIGNPIEGSYALLSLAACDGTTTCTVQVDVFIEYIAIWKELKDIGGS